MLSAVAAFFVSVFNDIDAITTAAWDASAPILIPLSATALAGLGLLAVRGARAKRGRR